MASGIPFADYLARANLDLESLRADMDAGTRVVEDGAKKMQARLDKTGFGANQAGNGVRNLSGRLSGLGQVATVADTRLGGFVGQLGGAAAGAGALLAGINPLIVGIGLLAAAIIANKEAIAGWITGANEMNKAAADLDARVAKMQETLSQRKAEQAGQFGVDAIRDQIALLKGEISQAEADANAVERAFRTGGFFAGSQKQAEQELRDLQAVTAESEKKLQIELASSNAWAQRVNLLQQEYALMTGLVSEADLLETQTERELFLRNQTVRALKEQQAIEEQLARSFAIEAGLAKESDFAKFGLERGLLAAREQRDAEREAVFSRPDRSFGITARDASAFRFQRSDSPNAILGEQRNEAKEQTTILKSIDKRFENAVRDLLRAFDVMPAGLRR